MTIGTSQSTAILANSFSRISLRCWCVATRASRLVQAVRRRRRVIARRSA
jgi:hypothetical protein